MKFKYSIHTGILKFIAATLLMLCGACILQAQTKQLLTWQDNLIYLQNIPDSVLEDEKDIVEKIRTGLEFWLQLHPESTVQLPDAPPQPWSLVQTRNEISALQKTVKALLRQ